MLQKNILFIPARSLRLFFAGNAAGFKQQRQASRE
jgi:hypothetical protein